MIFGGETMRTKRSLFIVILVCGILLLAVQPGLAYPSHLDPRVLHAASIHRPADGLSWLPQLSADGRFVTFSSLAGNLVRADTNQAQDVFVYDRLLGKTERVSVASTGDQANGDSAFSSISADGRYVAFCSAASNLVADDTNGFADVFVHDRQTGETRRVSVRSDGSQALAGGVDPMISANGRFVVFRSNSNDLAPDDLWLEMGGFINVYVHDLQTGETWPVSLTFDHHAANGDSDPASISADGQTIEFSSAANNLVPDDTNGFQDVFVHNTQAGAVEMVSRAIDSNPANEGSYGALTGLSADGRYAAFSSKASNLVPADTNGATDIFVSDRQAGAVERVSLAPGGGEANADSSLPSLSADGRYVAFASRASNLVPGDANQLEDIFVHDRQTGQTQRVSIAWDGAQANGLSNYAAISADGRFVAFVSAASNLVPGDTNRTEDVFLYDRQTGLTEIVSAGHPFLEYLPLIRR